MVSYRSTDSKELDKKRLIEMKYPYKDAFEELAIPMTNNAGHIEFSPDNRYLAIGNGAGKWITEIVDMDSREIIAAIPQSSATNDLCFDGDSEHLYLISEEFIDYSLVEKRIVASMRIGNYPHSFVKHPTQNLFVVCFHNSLIIIDCVTHKTVKALFCGRIEDWPHLSFRDTETPKNDPIAAENEEMIEKTRNASINTKVRPASLLFSSDGTMLFAATSAGLQVFEWEKVMNASNVTPEPLFICSELNYYVAERQERFRLNFGISHMRKIPFVYDVALDKKRNLLLFSGELATIGFINLTSRKCGLLLESPEESPFHSIIIADTNDVLATSAWLSLFEPGCKLHIWNYIKLLDNVDWE
mgnify:FL=1